MSRRTLIATSVFAVVVLSTHVTRQSLAAPPPSNAYVVEEKWKLVLNTPNMLDNSPQFSTGFKVNGTASFFTTFNFREYPNYQPGGIQMQWFEGGVCVNCVDVTLSSLNVSGDIVTWTHVYKLAGGNIENKLVGVNSQAWGQNINTDGLTMPNPGVATFNQYDPAVSVTESGIGYGANRVSWFGITEVRVYDDKGKKLVVDNTLRPVHAP